MAFPPTIRESVGEGSPKGVFGRSVDPAKYVIERSRFERPTIEIPRGPKFEWPVGVEGIRVTGRVGTAEHLYLGDNATVAQVTHRDSRTFEMSGVFPGITGSQNMGDLLSVVTAISPVGYWILKLPSTIFPRQQQVIVSDYSFDHPEDDREDSWFYTISFIRTGIGAKTQRVKTTRSPSNPTAKKKGTTPRVFTTKQGARTLRAVAQAVYKNPARYKDIYALNQKKLSGLNLPLVQLQTKELPLGMKLNY